MKITVNFRNILLAFIGTALLSAVTFWFLVQSSRGNGENIQLVDLEQGSSLRKMAGDLKAKGIIGSAGVLLLYARIMGDDGKIKAGTYQFNDGMSVTEIMRKLVAGEVFAVKFAVPEGYSMYQVAELLDNRGIFKKEVFLQRCADRELLRELQVVAPTVEGYLFPSTYDITPRMNEADLIRQMVGQFRKMLEQRHAQQVAPANLHLREVVILASMVEKEAVVSSERPLIASVFLNRLNKGMRLQSDPTAVYGLRAFGGKVTRKDILRDSAYNTYLIPGLPPGPVGNPGNDAIEAVFHPATSSYLYFVAKKDGTHAFSRTLQEHNEAVRHYLKLQK